MAIQHTTYHNGHFVLNKIPGPNGTRYSAWYTADGTLKDAACYDRHHRERTVPANARHVRAMLATYGTRYAKRTPNYGGAWPTNIPRPE